MAGVVRGAVVMEAWAMEALVRVAVGKVVVAMVAAVMEALAMEALARVAVGKVVVVMVGLETVPWLQLVLEAWQLQVMATACRLEMAMVTA